MKLKDYFGFQEVWGYYFRKKDPNRYTNTNLKMMHGVNKISMFMFLVAVVIILYRVISRYFF